MSNNTCSVVICQSPQQTCPRIVKCLGLCGAHYQRQRTYGDVQANIPLVERNVGNCQSPSGCQNPAKFLGLCSGHYQQQRRGEELRPLRKRGQPHGDGCDFPGCERPWGYWGKTEQYPGLCQGHYDQERRGTPLTPLKKRGEIGSGHISKVHGYKTIFVNGKHVKEHRYVMEQYVGRELLPGEDVHHRNGMKADNRITNLELKPYKHGRGQSIPDLLAWAHEIIDRYEGSNVEQVPYDESRSANRY